MNLAQMRECERVRHARNVSLPREIIFTESLNIDDTTVSEFCRIGPNANHGRCQGVWCKCPCHDAHEHFGFCGWGD